MLCDGNIVVAWRNGDLMPDLSSIRTDGNILWLHKPDVEVRVVSPLQQVQSNHHSQPSRASPPSGTHQPRQERGWQREIASRVFLRFHVALVATYPLDRHHQGSIFAFDSRWTRGQKEIWISCLRAFHCRFRPLAGRGRGKKTSPVPSRAVTRRPHPVVRRPADYVKGQSFPG